MDNFLKQTMLSDINAGEHFNVGDIGFIVLDHTSEGTLCIQDDLCEEKIYFDIDSNNFAKSDIRLYLNGAYYKQIVTEVGCDGIIEHEVDLKPLIQVEENDTYGKIKCFVSMLTVDLYRKYSNMIKSYRGYYWTVTPYSTRKNYLNDGNKACVISPYDLVRSCGYGDYAGVRPVCVFRSSIFVSKDN